ncbi:hypothetical protein [Hyalangium versicolor]|uniref:hypothetical protein n=1 Tax=Hyalangium versicolor TaxID=2861190 RepID=UPI001CCCA2AD|nr:hypothetical protein [Hyalangium versicolor]
MRKIELMLCCVAVLFLGGCVEGTESPQSSPTAEATQTASAEGISTEALQACFRAKQDLVQGVMNLVWKNQQGCATDADCKLVNPSISCQEICPVAVSVRAEKALSQALTVNAASACAKTPTVCAMQNTCIPWTGARCVANTCQAVIEPRAEN